MEKIIDGILTAAYLVIFTIGTAYSVQKAFYWTRNAALTFPIIVAKPLS